MSKVARLREMREENHERTQKAAKSILLERLKAQVPQNLGSIRREDAYEDRTSAAKALGSKGGKSKSPAKQAASRNNGKKPKAKRLASAKDNGTA